MSKVLIVLENHFFQDCDGNVWCDRVVDYNYLQRYLNVFENIIVAGRTEIVDTIAEEKLLVSGPRVEFVALPDFRGALGTIKNIHKVRTIIRETIKECSCAIYRAPTHLSLFTYKEILKSNKPLILEFMMAADRMFDGDSFIKSILNKYVDRETQKMCLRANGVSYVTDYTLQKKYPCMAIKEPSLKKFFTAEYSSISLSDDMYYEQNWEKNKAPEEFTFIHVGYMDSYRKGQDVTIKIFKEIIDKGYNAKLILIGDGSKRKEFEGLVEELDLKDRVEFKGLIKDKFQIVNCLRKSHFFVFPTKSEGLPRTIIEAMSQGLVCFSTPVDGIPELLDDEFLIDSTDVEEFSNKIVNMMNNWEKCCLESAKNYNKSLKYNEDSLSKKRTEFYKKVEGLIDNENKQ